MTDETPDAAQQSSTDEVIALVKKIIDSDPQLFADIMRETKEEPHNLVLLAAFLFTIKNAEAFKGDAGDPPEAAIALGMIKNVTEEVRLFFMLLIDTALAGIELQKKYDQFRLRSFIRTFFAFVEGMTFVLKQFTLKQVKRNELYEPQELMMLLEETPSISQKGEAETQQKFIPTDKNFLFAIKMAMKAVEPSFNIDTSREEWNCFKESIAVRNRITHPKDSAEMYISRTEYDKASKAFLWLFDQLLACGEKVAVKKENEMGKVGAISGLPIFQKLRDMFKPATP